MDPTLAPHIDGSINAIFWAAARSCRSTASGRRRMMAEPGRPGRELMTAVTSRDLDACQDWLETTVARLVPVAEGNS